MTGPVTPNIKTLSPAAFRACQDSPDVVVIDVRDPHEYAAGCEDGSCNWPLGLLTAGRVAALILEHGITPQHRLVLLCTRGMRAMQAAGQLCRLLPNEIAVVEGGHVALSGN